VNMLASPLLSGGKRKREHEGGRLPFVREKTILQRARLLCPYTRVPKWDADPECQPNY
jgi:hypothetical protein